MFRMLAPVIRTSPLRALKTTSTEPCAAVGDASLLALGRSVFFGTRRAEVTFLIGGPASGKGTLSQMVCDRLGYHHVSVGDLLREEMTNGSEIGLEVSPIVKSGGMVGSAVSVRLLLAHLERSLQEKGLGEVEQWIIDGFPRKVSSAELWEGLGFEPSRVIALEVGEDVMKYRVGGRGRMDDEPEVVRQRIEIHRREWGRVKAFYRERGLLTVVDAEGDREEVWKRLLVSMGSEFVLGSG